MRKKKYFVLIIMFHIFFLYANEFDSLKSYSFDDLVEKGVLPKDYPKDNKDASFYEWKISKDSYYFTDFKYKDNNIDIEIVEGEVYPLFVENGKIAGGVFVHKKNKNSFIGIKSIYKNFDLEYLYVRWDINRDKEILKSLANIDYKKRVHINNDDIETYFRKKLNRLYRGSFDKNEYFIDKDKKYLHFMTSYFSYEPYGDLANMFSKDGMLIFSIRNKEFLISLLKFNNFREFKRNKNFYVLFSPKIKTSFIESKMDKINENRLRVQKMLNIENNDIINIYFFENNEESLRIINESLGFAYSEDRMIFMRQNQSYGHETNHILSYEAFGESHSDFLNEGFATLYDGNDSDHHQMTSKILKEDSVSLKDLRNGKYFYRNAQDLNYPVAASFVRYFIEKYGIEKFGVLWKSEEFVKDFKKITGENFDAFVNGWLGMILKNAENS